MLKKLYVAANLQEAHLLQGLLEQEGISSRILNQFAQGALGEIPFTHTYPEIWVEHAGDLLRARDLVEAYERGGAEIGGACTQCGEDNPATFETCWHCGAPLK